MGANVQASLEFAEAGTDDGEKGIRAVLQERGLWPAAGIRLSCSKKMGRLDGGCCARHLLGSQPDFQGLFQEKIEERGHLVVYYPKYHPELNFIEYF